RPSSSQCGASTRSRCIFAASAAILPSSTWHNRQPSANVIRRAITESATAGKWRRILRHCESTPLLISLVSKEFAFPRPALLFSGYTIAVAIAIPDYALASAWIFCENKHRTFCFWGGSDDGAQQGSTAERP